MKRLPLLLLFLFICQFLLAWGQNGHRIVAQICWDNLSPQVRDKVMRTLGNDYIAQVATWPDFIRSEKNWDFTKPWHFITVNPDETVQDVINNSAKNDDIDNVAEAIEFMKRILMDDVTAIDKFQALMDKNKVEPLSGSVHATALAFLVHFIGDIHQPLHCGKNNDFGANKIIVLFFSEKSNLHSVWDEGIIEKEQLSFTEFSDFVQKHELPMKSKCENDAISTWVNESIEAREQIYNTIYDATDRDTGLPNLSYQYQHDFLPIVEKRLAAAGFRAAAIINKIFG